MVSGSKEKILKRIEFDSIVHYVQKENIDFIYVRYVHNASPFSIRLMKLLKKTGARIVMEIPTYPYDQEYKGLPIRIPTNPIYRQMFPTASGTLC